MVSDSQGHLTFSWPTDWWRTMVFGLVLAASIGVAYLIFERFLRATATILLLALMFTYLLQPVVDWLVGCCHTRYQHAARITSVLLLYLSFALALFLLALFTTRTVTHELHALKVTIISARQTLPDRLAEFRQWYEETAPVNVQEWVRVSIDNEIRQIPDKYGPQFKEWVVNALRQSGRWIGALLELIFVPLIAFYLLIDGAKIHEQVMEFVPERSRASVLKYAGGMGKILRQYVRSQLILCTIAWVVVTIALLLMGIPGALLLGLFAGISRAIPVVGPMVGGIPVLAAVLLDPHMSSTVWWVLLAFAGLHLFESKYLMPRILGENLGIHPVLIIVSLLVGYQMLGLLGMFIAPPAVAMIRFILATRRGAITDQNDESVPTSVLPDIQPG